MLVFTILVSSLSHIVFSQKLAGPFYVVNEGFLPRVFAGDYATYVTELKPINNDWEDKEINGWFHVKEKMKNLGFTIQAWKESRENWLKCGPLVEFPNLCNLTFSMKYFMKAFTGKLTHDPCSLDAGNYTLTSYSFESDLKETIGTRTFFGHYKYSITVSGTVDEYQRDGLKVDMMMWIKDLDYKHAIGRPGIGKNKSSG